MRIWALLVCGVLSMATASADTGRDGAFLDELRRAGITHSGAAQAVAAGNAVCDLMDAGLTNIQVWAAVQGANPAMGPQVAAKFAVISAWHYCPEHV